MGCFCSKDQKLLEINGKKIIIQPAVFPRKWTKEVLNQQLNSVCQITTKETKATGFLCKIPNLVLITSNSVLNIDQIKPGNEINIYFTEDEDRKQHKIIKINEKRSTYSIGTINNEKIDTTIIEINSDEDGLKDKEFIEIDEGLMSENVKQSYTQKDCYLIHYEKGENLVTTLGKIYATENKNKSFTLYHTCDSDQGSTGGPILLNNNKVIGVNVKRSPGDNFYRAVLLKYPIQEYLKKLESQKEKNKLQTEDPGKLENNRSNKLKEKKEESQKLLDVPEKLGINKYNIEELKINKNSTDKEGNGNNDDL